MTKLAAITDNGSQFVSNSFKNFLKSNGIMHQLTPPYSAQCNPAERVNKVVKTMMKIYFKENQRKWGENLPEIQFAIQDSTGFSPAELNFGRQLRSANTLFDEESPARHEQVVALPELSERMTDFKLAKRQMESVCRQQAK